LTWDVEGDYKITAAETDGNPFDASGCSLGLFFTETVNLKRQLYAAFKFDSLDGIMRICPDKKNEVCFLERFEELCDLGPKEQPGPNNTRWFMRWRARDGGMRLGKLVGGEMDQDLEFSFKHDASCSSADFTAINLLFCMEYENNFFVFHASKTSNLGKKGEHSISTMDSKWYDLLDFKWVDDSASSSADPDSETDTSVSRLSVSSYLTGLPRLIGNVPPRTKDRYIEKLPSWAWDMTGEWTVIAPELAKDLDVTDPALMTMTVEMPNNPQHTKASRQLWAMFHFGRSFSRIMRFAPGESTLLDQSGTPWKTLRKDVS